MDELFQFKEDQAENAVAPKIDPFRSSMAEALNCAVCNEVFTDPHLLSCGHCFCGPCLFNWFRTKKSCPKCRLAVVKTPIKAFCIQYAADVLCEHSPHISRSGNTEVIRREQWTAFFAAENQAGYIVDTEDFVRRCITCAWEIGTDNICHNCGAQYNSDPEHRDDTADEDSDNEPLDYEREFGVTVEQQRNIYQDIQNRRTSGNDSLYDVEASDDDNVISDDSSENRNYRDEEDLDEFVVSDDHYDSSVNGASSVYSSDEEQYAIQSQQTVSVNDSSDDERQILGRGSGGYVNLDEEDTDDDDDGVSTLGAASIQELHISSEEDSAGEGPSTRMNNLSISSSSHNLQDLDTSSEEEDGDSPGEGPSTGPINTRDKGKRVIRDLSSDDSESSDDEDDEEDEEDEEDDHTNNTNAAMDDSKHKKANLQPKTKSKKASKKRKRKAKAKTKGKPKKSKAK